MVVVAKAKVKQFLTIYSLDVVSNSQNYSVSNAFQNVVLPPNYRSVIMITLLGVSWRVQRY